MKIIITEETITLSEIGWSCDIVLSNSPGATFIFRSDGHPTAILNTDGETSATVELRKKSDGRP